MNETTKQLLLARAEIIKHQYNNKKNNVVVKSDMIRQKITVYELQDIINKESDILTYNKQNAISNNKQNTVLSDKHNVMTNNKKTNFMDFKVQQNNKKIMK